MQRTRTNKKVSAILCSDIHLREDVPVCRTDDYWTCQWKKMDFISNLQKVHNCPVWCGGDLFDKARPSLNLVRETILHIPDQFHSVAGQHDLVAHSLDLIDKCGLKLLEVAGKLDILDGTHFGKEPIASSLFVNERYDGILVWHKLAYQTPPYPGATGGNAKHLLQKYPYDLIITGDNHLTFVEEYQGRLLVNPGSMMRMTADQIDHKPCVFLWYAEDNTVQQVFLPIEEGVVTREHIEKVEQRDERISSFIERLDKEYEIGMSFEQNLEVFLNKNQVRDSVKQIIYTSLE